MPRVKLRCPWCGADLERMPRADRIKEKRAPGSRIEKDIAKCPQCSKIIYLRTPPAGAVWRSAKWWAVWVVVLLTGAGLSVLIYLMRKP